MNHHIEALKQEAPTVLAHYAHIEASVFVRGGAYPTTNEYYVEPSQYEGRVNTTITYTLSKQGCFTYSITMPIAEAHDFEQALYNEDAQRAEAQDQKDWAKIQARGLLDT